MAMTGTTFCCACFGVCGRVGGVGGEAAGMCLGLMLVGFRRHRVQGALLGDCLSGGPCSRGSWLDAWLCGSAGYGRVWGVMVLARNFRVYSMR